MVFASYHLLVIKRYFLLKDDRWIEAMFPKEALVMADSARKKTSTKLMNVSQNTAIEGFAD
jgi:hypothetical protein